MSDIFSNLNDIKQKSDDLKTQKVARFAYTSVAYDNDDYAGVENYSAPAEQNIPAENKTDLNDTIINKGVRSQAASIPRNTLNHFFGRTSYNLNKLVEWFNTLITDLPRQFAANGSRYSATAKYRQYDICTFVDSTVTPPQVRYFFRSSADPAELVNSPPMTGGAVNTAQWSEYSDVAARAHSYVRRDANGRAKMTAPSAADDIAIKQTVDDHAALTSPHSSTSAATASSLMLRDAAGRSKVAAPAAADDIARKAEADAVQTNLNSHSAETAAGTHGSTVAATANRGVHRDAAGRAQIAAPSADADIANRGWVRDYCIPIGMVYVQGPADAAPSTLWPGTTWTNVSSEEAGLFRRFEGGAALAFGGGAQASQNRLHNHGGASGGMSANNPHSHGIMRGAVAGGDPHVYGTSSAMSVSLVTQSANIEHTHSIAGEGGAEARPDNVTVRKWRRTA